MNSIASTRPATRPSTPWHPGRVAQAEARARAMQQEEARVKELVARNIASAQTYETAVAEMEAANAALLVAKAELQVAEIALERTVLRAPLSGVIGRSLTTQGALVTAGQASPLAVIRMLDPVLVDVTQSAAEMLAWRRGQATSRLAGADLTVTLHLGDGTPYEYTGTLTAADPHVDELTGVVTLRMKFPNPDRLLLPGMYVQVEMPQGVEKGVVLAPQEGVGRDRRGRPTALVVNAENVVELRDLTVLRARGLRLDRHQGSCRPAIASSSPGCKRRVQAPPSSRRNGTPPQPRPTRGQGMARFFIDRPVFAWVISIIIMGIGVLSVMTLPVAQYPAIAPPTISVTANYTGASAETVSNTVTQIIEQRMTGLDGLRYMSSTSTSAGTSEISLTFQSGTDPDIAQVQVQNKLGQAVPLLPEPVQRLGVTVRKANRTFLMVVALSSEDGSLEQVDLADYLASNLVDEFSRIEGVGNIRAFGAPYAMRIWLDPAKLAAYELTASDVVGAVRAQNAQVSAGAFGELPALDGQMLNATVTAQSLLEKPEDFEQIVLRAETDGGLVLLKDVARIEIGAESYQTIARFGRNPAAGMAIQLAANANALDTADRVRERLEELAPYFPEGMVYSIPYDTTPFISISIEEVVKTLIEAVVLVFCVMLLFLQNLRATLIPTLAVPIVLLGTFGVLAAAGFTINTLTMLAMVLAIGLLVDDAIVVVENVERLMEEEGLDPREATRKSMGQITGALIGIALVLSAVFVPMAFFGGSTGVIYRQFSVAIVSAMVLSVIVALTLSAGALRHDPEGRAPRRPARPLRLVQHRLPRNAERLFEQRRMDRPPAAAHSPDLPDAGRRHGLALPEDADRVPAERGPGNPVHLRPGPDGCHGRADARRHQDHREPLPRRRGAERRDDVRRRRLLVRRARPEHGDRLCPAQGLGRAGTPGPERAGRRRAGIWRAVADPRRLRLPDRAALGDRAWQRLGLRFLHPGPRGPDPRRTPGRAQPVAGHDGAEPDYRARPAERAGGRGAIQPEDRLAGGRRHGRQRRQGRQPPDHRLGRGLRERFPEPGPDQARDRAGRAIGPRRTR